jgi:hypothetical protein
MSGVISLLPLYAFTEWTWTGAALSFTITGDSFQGDKGVAFLRNQNNHEKF